MRHINRMKGVRVTRFFLNIFSGRFFCRASYERVVTSVH